MAMNMLRSQSGTSYITWPLHHLAQKQLLILNTTSNIKEGEELAISYGAYGAAKYFVRYGFYEPRLRDEYLVTYVNEIPIRFPRSDFDRESPTYSRKRAFAVASPDLETVHSSGLHPISRIDLASALVEYHSHHAWGECRQVWLPFLDSGLSEDFSLLGRLLHSIWCRS